MYPTDHQNLSLRYNFDFIPFLVFHKPFDLILIKSNYGTRGALSYAFLIMKFYHLLPNLCILRFTGCFAIMAGQLQLLTIQLLLFSSLFSAPTVRLPTIQLTIIRPLLCGLIIQLPTIRFLLSSSLLYISDGLVVDCAHI